MPNLSNHKTQALLPQPAKRIIASQSISHSNHSAKSIIDHSAAITISHVRSRKRSLLFRVKRTVPCQHAHSNRSGIGHAYGIGTCHGFRTSSRTLHLLSPSMIRMSSVKLRTYTCARTIRSIVENENDSPTRERAPAAHHSG
jgi:hypothetical protein